jgi:hypothetical protein
MILRIVVFGAACICFLHGLDGLESAHSQQPHSANSPASTTDALAVAPQMQSLIKVIAGRWSISEKLEPSEATPNGGVGEGEEIWRPGPGGFTLLEEEHIRTPYGERFLLSLQWWDKSTNSFHGMLCNGSGPAGCNLESTKSVLNWDGKRYVIDMEFSSHDKKMMWHEVFTDFTATSFTQTGDIGEVGGPLKRSITIHATKIGEADSPFSK